MRAEQKALLLEILARLISTENIFLFRGIVYYKKYRYLIKQKTQPILFTERRPHCDKPVAFFQYVSK